MSEETGQENSLRSRWRKLGLEQTALASGLTIYFFGPREALGALAKDGKPIRRCQRTKARAGQVNTHVPPRSEDPEKPRRWDSGSSRLGGYPADLPPVRKPGARRSSPFPALCPGSSASPSWGPR